MIATMVRGNERVVARVVMATILTVIGEIVAGVTKVMVAVATSLVRRQSHSITHLTVPSVPQEHCYISVHLSWQSSFSPCSFCLLCQHYTSCLPLLCKCTPFSLCPPSHKDLSISSCPSLDGILQEHLWTSNCSCRKAMTLEALQTQATPRPF